MGPHVTSRWNAAGTVEAFSRSAPNATLMRFAEQERRAGSRVLDIGCGAGRNAVPLANQGWHVLGLDLSRPMLDAAVERHRREPGGLLTVAMATMDRLPAADASVDLVVAHGIWNLARSVVEFRTAVREAARVARPGAGLFVFTFSRTTLPPDTEPRPGEHFVFTEFSGEPQCFLTAGQLLAELEAAGFDPDPTVPLTEHNRPRPGSFSVGTAPVIYECAFRRSQSNENDRERDDDQPEDEAQPA
jgi:SAM-dependent methyltransferase